MKTNIPTAAVYPAVNFATATISPGSFRAHGKLHGRNFIHFDGTLWNAL